MPNSTPDQTGALLDAILKQTETLGRVAQISGNNRDAVNRLIEQAAALDKSVSNFGYNVSQLQKDFDDMRHTVPQHDIRLDTIDRQADRVNFDLYGDAKNDGTIDTVKKLKNDQDARTAIFSFLHVLWGAGATIIGLIIWAITQYLHNQQAISTAINSASGG